MEGDMFVILISWLGKDFGTPSTRILVIINARIPKINLTADIDLDLLEV